MKYRLIKPELEHKDKYKEFLDEFVSYNSEINGTGFMDRILDGVSYEEALKEVRDREDYDYSIKVDRAQGKTYILVDEDNEILGSINIRYNLRQELIDRGITHIGYSIRPTKRRQGLAKLMLYHGLKVLDMLNESVCKLDCYSSNEGSWRTMEALGGKLVKEGIDPSDNSMTRWYDIDVKESLDKYKDTYNDLLSEPIKL